VTSAQNSSRLDSRTTNKRPLMLLVLPLGACMFSSVVGIAIGQLGNLLYAVIGEAASWLALPGFCSLFLVTFGLSFLSTRFLRKWLVGSGR